MNNKFIFFFIIALIFTGTESIFHADYTSITEAPYFVSIVAFNQHVPYCGGSIISEYWILTAAHCAVLYNDRIQVRAGSSTQFSKGDIHDVEKVFIHGDYERYFFNPQIGYNDIAVFKLKTPITFNEHKQPIKVNSQFPENVDTITMVGLGSENMRLGRPSPSLKKATGTVYLRETNEWNIYLPSVFILASADSEVCSGDSGSPAVYNGDLIGVLSAAPACAQSIAKNPYDNGLAFYTRTDMFYNWIMEITNIKYKN